MRVFRWLMIVVVVVVLVVAAAIGYVYFAFDPNDHRDQVVDLVKEKTGRTLRLNAPMSLSFFPWLGVRLEKVTLENPEGFDGEPLVSAGELGVKVQVMPLLNGQLVVNTLILDGVKLNLIRKQDGRDNWSDLLAAEKQPAKAPVQGETEGWLKGYAVQGVELTNGMFRWRDEAAGADYVAEEVNLSTGSITPGAAVPLKASLRFAAADKKLGGRLTAQGDLGLSEDFRQLSVPDLHVGLELEGDGMPASGLKTEVRGKLNFDNAAGKVEVADLSISGPSGVSLVGGLTGEGLNAAPVFRSALTLQPLNLRKLMAELGGEVPRTSDPTVLEALQGKLELIATKEKVAIKPLSLKLDDTNLDGTVDVSLNETMKIAFSAKVDAIDVDRYLPPPDETSEKSAGQTNPASGLGALAMVDANGTLTIETLKVSGLTMKKTRVTIKSGGGEIKLDPMSANLYEGSYAGSLRAKAAGKTVNWRVTEKLEGIQIGPLLKDLVGEERLEGKGHLEADLSGSGLSDADVRRTAQGQMSFAFRDGALKGINLAQVAREVKARLRGQTVKQEGPQQTDFSELTGSLAIGQGKAKNKDLVMKSPFVRVEGQGEADLVSEALDYLLTAKVVTTAKGQGGGEFSDLEGIPIGVRVGGTFTEPTFSPDLEAAVKALAGKRIEEEKAKLQEQAEQEVEKQQKKLEEKASEELGKALKKLF